jgi:predicted AAA+ superfamily ATPase
MSVMERIPRLLEIDLPEGQSAFLWGPRKTGKTTYLKSALPNSITYNLLETDLFLELTKRPYLLREQLLAADPLKLKEPIIIDEGQKLILFWAKEKSQLRSRAPVESITQTYVPLRGSLRAIAPGNPS